MLFEKTADLVQCVCVCVYGVYPTSVGRALRLITSLKECFHKDQQKHTYFLSCAQWYLAMKRANRIWFVLLKVRRWLFSSLFSIDSPSFLSKKGGKKSQRARWHLQISFFLSYQQLKTQRYSISNNIKLWKIAHFRSWKQRLTAIFTLYTLHSNYQNGYWLIFC